MLKYSGVMQVFNINRSSGACGAAAVWQVRILRVCLVVLEGDWGGANL